MVEIACNNRNIIYLDFYCENIYFKQRFFFLAHNKKTSPSRVVCPVELFTFCATIKKRRETFNATYACTTLIHFIPYSIDIVFRFSGFVFFCVFYLYERTILATRMYFERFERPLFAESNVYFTKTFRRDFRIKIRKIALESAQRSGEPK